MKLKSVFKIDKRNKLTSKKIGDDVMLAHCDVIVDDVMLARCDVIFIFPSGSQILDTDSVKLTFSLTINFYLLSENRTKKSLTQLSYYCFE